MEELVIKKEVELEIAKKIAEFGLGEYSDEELKNWNNSYFVEEFIPKSILKNLERYNISWNFKYDYVNLDVQVEFILFEKRY